MHQTAFFFPCSRPKCLHMEKYIVFYNTFAGNSENETRARPQEARDPAVVLGVGKQTGFSREDRNWPKASFTSCTRFLGQTKVPSISAEFCAPWAVNITWRVHLERRRKSQNPRPVPYGQYLCCLPMSLRLILSANPKYG